MLRRWMNPVPAQLFGNCGTAISKSIDTGNDPDGHKQGGQRKRPRQNIEVRL